MQDMTIFCVMSSPLHLPLMWTEDDESEKKLQVKARLPNKTTNISSQIGLGSDAEAALSASGERL